MKTRTAMTLAITFAVGAAAGALAKGKPIDPSTYRGKSGEDAAAALVSIAKAQAGTRNWENIAIGRVLYASGSKDEGRAIFDAVTSKKTEASDWLRMGRAYWDAGDWENAKEAFGKALEGKPKEASWLAEVGAYYNLKGEREKAEELFDRSFAVETDVLWHTVNIAGSYAGVEPLR